MAFDHVFRFALPAVTARCLEIALLQLFKSLIQAFSKGVGPLTHLHLSEFSNDLVFLVFSAGGIFLL